MSSWKQELRKYQSCFNQIERLKPKLQKKYAGHYICVAVNSGSLGLGKPSDNDRDGHQAALNHYESKCGKILEPTLFLGYRL